MRLKIGLDGNYDFFKQDINLGKYKKELRFNVSGANMKKLSKCFYHQTDVVSIAQELLGKILVTNWKGKITSGRIVESEAYAGTIDKASHASGGRRTARNEIMYGPGGFAYVYLCYGIHHLFNVVTNSEDIPHAILIRALEPVAGIKEMLRRRGKKKFDHTLTCGPGNVSKALGITTGDSGISLLGNSLFIAEDDAEFSRKQIASSARIGVEYAGKDALLPYRFYIKGNPFVSGKPR